jgi:DNA-binding transcriptional ArsR family regulator
VAARFRVLGTPSRLRLLDQLLAGPQGLGALARACGLTLSNASRQVAALEAAGCVARERRGRDVEVRVVDPTLEDLCRLVCGALRDQVAGQGPLARALGAGARPR